jgi:hypothetical protein
VFYEGIVPAARLPASFGVDIPVLRVVFPERSFFDTDEFELRPEAQEIVAIVAESLRKEPPDVTLFVAGHTDSRGNDDYNEALSIDRANSIATAIFAKGISLASIWRIGFGEDMPLYSGSTSYDFDRNRRVEFLFASKVEAVSDWLATQQSSGLCQGSSQRETDLCRQKLRFRQDYVAERISSSRPVQVSMSRAVKRGGHSREHEADQGRTDRAGEPPGQSGEQGTGSGPARGEHANPDRSGQSSQRQGAHHIVAE